MILISLSIKSVKWTRQEPSLKLSYIKSAMNNLLKLKLSNINDLYN
jgi:hypothetical protein